MARSNPRSTPRCLVLKGSAYLLAVCLAASACTDTVEGPGDVDLRQLPAQLVGLASGAGRVVGVGGISWGDYSAESAVHVWDSDSISLMTSADGTTWRAVPLERPGFLYSVAHGNGAFVAVGRGSYLTRAARSLILRSTDGENWSEVPSDSSVVYRSITFTNGYFVATAPNIRSATIVARSRDGVTWKHVAEVSSFETTTFAGGGIFVVTAHNSGVVLWSEDGAQWTAQPTLQRLQIRSITFDGNGFVGSGNVGCCSDGWAGFNYTIRSANGREWSASPQPQPAFFMAMAFGKGIYVGVQSDGVYSSTSGDNWDRRFAIQSQPGPLNYYSAVIHHNDRFVVGGWGSVLTSSDGVTWTKSTLPMP